MATEFPLNAGYIVVIFYSKITSKIILKYISLSLKGGRERLTVMKFHLARQHFIKDGTLRITKHFCHLHSIEYYFIFHILI